MNLCPDWFCKNLPVTQSVVYCSYCEGKLKVDGGFERGQGLINFLLQSGGGGGGWVARGLGALI